MTRGTYTGQLKDGKPHGRGTMVYPNGAKYVGGWKDGMRHGQGIFTFSDGAKYIDEWKDDKLECR